MSHPLDGSFAKLYWAKKHTDVLKAEVVAAPDSLKTVTIGQEFKSDTNTIEIKPVHIPELPVAWTLTAADALQSFRASLNYLAWELARWHLDLQGKVREPDSKTQFPIGTKSFPERQVKDLHPNHVAVLKALQPYDRSYLSRAPEALARGDDMSTMIALHPLARLRRLSNSDKHKLLGLAFLAGNWAGFEVTPRRDCRRVIASRFSSPKVLQLGTPYGFAEVIPTGPNPEVNVEEKFVTEVAFEDGSRIIEVLDDIGAEVSRILRKFEPVFEGSPISFGGQHLPAAPRLLGKATVEPTPPS